MFTKLFFAMLVGGTSLALTSCSEDVPATSKVTSTVFVGAGNEKENGPERCKLVPSEQIQIGQEGAAVYNGEQQNKADVSVFCRVYKTESGKFRVQANAVLQGTGSFAVVGDFTPEGTQENIAVTINPASVGAFKQSNCTVTYDPNMTVAEGRVWGKIECPRMELSDQDRTCRGFGTFKFENCDQVSSGF